MEGDAEHALLVGERLLRRHRYRVQRYGSSIAAERGYLRETGNLVFHAGLVGVLVSVFIGGGFTYTGQRVVAVGQTFVNEQQAYDSISTGRFFGDSSLQPYAITLDSLAVKYEQHNLAALGEPIDYTAKVTTQVPGQQPQHQVIKVNDPLSIGGSEVYLLGNGYAARISVRDAKGKVIYGGTVPFRPQNNEMTSLGVVKVGGAQPGADRPHRLPLSDSGQAGHRRARVELPRPREPGRDLQRVGGRPRRAVRRTSTRWTPRT